MYILDVNVESERLKLDVVSKAQRLIEDGYLKPSQDAILESKEDITQYQVRLQIFEALLTDALESDIRDTLSDDAEWYCNGRHWQEFIRECLVDIWKLMKEAVDAEIDAAIYENNMLGQQLFQEYEMGPSAESS